MQMPLLVWTVNGTEALSVSITMLPVSEDALSLLRLARLIFLPGLTPARDFERVEVSFQARLGGFGSDTPISCDRLSGVHRMDNYSVLRLDSYSEVVSVQCHTRIGFPSLGRYLL